MLNERRPRLISKSSTSSLCSPAARGAPSTWSVTLSPLKTLTGRVRLTSAALIGASSPERWAVTDFGRDLASVDVHPPHADECARAHRILRLELPAGCRVAQGAGDVELARQEARDVHGRRLAEGGVKPRHAILCAPAVAIAQPAEHRIVDPKVMGSTPIGHPNSLPTTAGQPARLGASTIDGHQRLSVSGFAGNRRCR